MTRGWTGGVLWMVCTSVGQGDVVVGTQCGDITSEAVCGVEGSTTSERQRTRGLRTGAYTVISDVSGSLVMASGMDSSATSVGVIGASLEVDGFFYD